MDAALNRKSLMLGVPGILLQIVGNIVMRSPELSNLDPSLAVKPSAALEFGGLAIALIGTALLILGLSWYARAKGHSGWWGLLGLASIFGLIALACIKDKNKQPA